MFLTRKYRKKEKILLPKTDLISLRAVESAASISCYNETKHSSSKSKETYFESLYRRLVKETRNVNIINFIIR